MKEKNKYIPSVILAVLSYVLSISGAVCIAWGAALKKSVEYRFADELKDWNISKYLGFSDVLLVNVKKVDYIFVLGLAIVIFSLIVAVIAVTVYIMTQNAVIVRNVNTDKKEYCGSVKAEPVNAVSSPIKVSASEKVAISKEQESMYGRNPGVSVRTDIYETSITCVSGIYKGFVFPISGNEKIVIGSNPQVSNIVLVDESGISRYHCSLVFDFFNNCYLVTDYSLNGTFLMSGKRLPQNIPVKIRRGEIILLGDGTNTFRLE